MPSDKKAEITYGPFETRDKTPGIVFRYRHCAGDRPWHQVRLVGNDLAAARYYLEDPTVEIHPEDLEAVRSMQAVA